MTDSAHVVVDLMLVGSIRALCREVHNSECCAGTKTVRRSKVTGHMKKNKAGYFWRHSFDEQGCQVVTDRPVTDFLEKQ